MRRVPGSRAASRSPVRAAVTAAAAPSRKVRFSASTSASVPPKGVESVHHQRPQRGPGSGPRKAASPDQTLGELIPATAKFHPHGLQFGGHRSPGPGVPAKWLWLSPVSEMRGPASDRRAERRSSSRSCWYPSQVSMVNTEFSAAGSTASRSSRMGNEGGRGPRILQVASEASRRRFSQIFCSAPRRVPGGASRRGFAKLPFANPHSGPEGCRHSLRGRHPGSAPGRGGRCSGPSRRSPEDLPGDAVAGSDTTGCRSPPTPHGARSGSSGRWPWIRWPPGCRDPGPARRHPPAPPGAGGHSTGVKSGLPPPPRASGVAPVRKAGMYSNQAWFAATFPGLVRGGAGAGVV